MSQIAEFSETDNPYRSPAAGQSALMPDAGVSELQAFVGPNANYFLKKWAPRLQSPSAEVGMNWAAFFLPGIWFCYRKMFRVALIFFGVLFLISILEEVVFVGVIGAPITPPAINLITKLVIAIICGVYGNHWYLSHARRAISDARAQGFEDDHLLHVLAKRGGTSLLAGIGVPFLFFMVVIVLSLFLFILRHAI